MSAKDYSDDVRFMIRDYVIKFVNESYKSSASSYELYSKSLQDAQAKTPKFVDPKEAKNQAKVFETQKMSLKNLITTAYQFKRFKNDKILLKFVVGAYSAIVDKYIKDEAGLKLYFAEHPYGSLFSPARKCIEKRTDLKGKSKIVEKVGKIVYRGKVCLSSSDKKVKMTIKIGFFTKGKQNFCFEIKGKKGFKFSSPNLPEDLKEISTWNTTVNKNKLNVNCGKKLENDELSKVMHDMPSYLDKVVLEGKTICEKISQDRVKNK
jgi:hypothetical protein